jgi:hypothetical protein
MHSHSASYDYVMTSERWPSPVPVVLYCERGLYLSG